MSTFVLVHGAWQTAATWDLLAPILRERGSRVVTPLLTGLGTHPTPLSPAVTLAQHIEDVCAAVRAQTGPVVLVGHSYAGMILTAAAERVAVDSLAYLDAFLPRDGQSVLDLLPSPIAAHFRQVAEEQGEGWRLPGTAEHLDLWGLPAGPARDLAQARLCDFSLRCFEEPVALPADRAARLPGRYLTCTASRYPARPVFAPFADQARENAWPVYEIPTGHACQLENPQAVADALLAIH